MKAILLEKPAPIDEKPLKLTELPVPEPAPGELLLRVAACGVCRTDLQICEGDVPARKLPVVPGHQIVGRVEALGDGVEGWRVGDRAGIGWLAGSCGHCSFCRSGRENLCAEARFTGWDLDGGFEEYVTVRADFAFRLPDGFGDLQAAPLLCGGVIGYRSLKRSAVKPGSRLGLYGFGASALLTIQVALHWGCEVYVCTRSAREQERARRIGATWVGGYDELPPMPLDGAITFAPAGQVVVDALRAVDRGGTVAINAIHLDKVPEFPYDLLWWERNLCSVANYTRADAREFLELAAAIPVRTETDLFDLEDANEALRRLSAGEISGAAVLRIG
ncbi:MAG: zinc-dependent alcohol dehydrogenase family protein [Dehalococcoidia bacterium]